MVASILNVPHASAKDVVADDPEKNLTALLPRLQLTHPAEELFSLPSRVSIMTNLRSCPEHTMRLPSLSMRSTSYA